MPADKDAAKRRRQARNRQERENRQARTEGAKRSAARPSRTVEETPTRSAKGPKTDLSKTPASPAPAPGGLMGKLFPPRPQPTGEDGEERPTRPARPVRPPSAVVEVGEIPGPRGVLLRLTAQPGGRAAVLALLVAVVSGVALFVTPVGPPSVLERYGAMVMVQADGGDPFDAEAVDAVQDDFVDADPVTAEYSVSLLDLVPATTAIIFAVIPVILAGLAVRSLTRPTRSRTLMICSIAGVAYVVLGGPIGIFFLLGVLSLGFAAYQSAKADRAALAASA